MIKDIYNLTSLQEGMLFHTLNKEADESPYFEQLSFDIVGEFESDLLKQSFEELVKRHEALRTIFVHKKTPKPKQIVLKTSTLKFDYEDISQLEDPEALMQAFEESDRRAYFELAKEPPIRVKVFKDKEQHYRVILSHHHIIMDGWSLSILIKELMLIYTALKKHQPTDLKPTTPYSHYIKWLAKQDMMRAKAFWQEYLANYETPSTLPYYTATKKYQRAKERVQIDAQRTSQLTAMCKSYGITLNTLLETLFAILLSKYNDTKDIVFGTTVSGRAAEIEGVENTVGLFINTIPVRIRYDKNQTLESLLSQVMQNAIEAKAYHHYSLADIQNLTPLKTALINQLMVFENYPISQTKEEEAGFSVENVHNFSQTNYDFIMVFFTADTISIDIEYNSLKLKKERIEHIQNAFIKLIDTAIKQPTIKVTDINILSPKEEAQIESLNIPHTPYPKDKSIIELFEAQVAKTPNATALIYQDRVLSYQELNQKANALGHYLRSNYAIQPDTIIPIMMNRSEWMIIAILGILKSSGAYLPIDPEYPDERIDFILQDSQASLWISDQSNLEVAKTYDEIETLNIETLDLQTFTEKLEALASNDLAYIMYTSGSTGNPKGVMIPQRGVVRLVQSQNYLDFDNSLSILQASSVSFDAATFEIWGALLNGGKLLLYPHAKIDIDEYNSFLEQSGVNTLWLTARLFDQWVESANLASLQQLKYLLTGGDVVSKDSATKLHHLNPNIQIINGYGPTENTTFTSCFRLQFPLEYPTIPIGRPIANTQTYILDQALHTVPFGAIGELCIGGDGLARGYLNQKDLSSAKFIEHPKLGRVYKSGDRARYREDGTIEYLGRVDNQVKIRGFRVELGEIEHALKKDHAIKEGVVLIKTSNDQTKELVAYLLLDEKANTNIEAIRKALRTHLPEYMIPRYFVLVEQLPLTPNGKIDTHALANLPINETSSTHYKAPINTTQSTLIAIFKEILGLSDESSIGIDDNFFDLGGHSLLATQLISKIKKEFGIDISIKALFEHPRIEALAKIIEGTSQESPEKSLDAFTQAQSPQDTSNDNLKEFTL